MRRSRKTRTIVTPIVATASEVIQDLVHYAHHGDTLPDKESFEMKMLYGVFTACIKERVRGHAHLLLDSVKIEKIKVKHIETLTPYGGYTSTYPTLVYLYLKEHEGSPMDLRWTVRLAAE